ncbi:MAG TPA: glycerophosphodiester phosphodiesterase family protein [Thermoflexales bacterium]|nr:glycerophosphodiester phosphodiesterase family protein [Thermoflexales bacterium]HQW34407.1 glycerophosphodiester phosphodiesterase family protein [Thermoflexales bacterium]HQZ21642.1 glycerophosphodiester phosphodiesterase family protein [Thermoflexales bacterium]
MICIGHRGAMGYEPENTLRSFRKALDMGAPWVELDVYNVENQLVVIHDDDLDRTTNGKGAVMKHTVAQLRALDAGKGERIPFLSEVFDAVNRRAAVNVELKGPNTAELAIAEMRKRVAAGWKWSDLLISSFDHAQLHRARELEPNVPLGVLVWGNAAPFIKTALALKAVSLNPALQFTDKALVDEAHANGLKVFVYTVNEPDDIARMRAWGVDGVFTNFPDRALS